MGLDMYLNAKRYVSEFSPKDTELRAELDKLTELTNGLRINEVTVEVMYWRKANAIHKWFVDNVQGGVDNCGEYRVSINQLRTLADLCQEVVTNKKPELLPTANGFFFGAVDYDEYYYADLMDTADRLNELLNDKNIVDGQYSTYDFVYQSSW
jgi:hypothetical protein